MGVQLNYLTFANSQCVSQWVTEGWDFLGVEETEDPPVVCEYGSARELSVVRSEENELVSDSSVHPENGDYILEE